MSAFLGPIHFWLYNKIQIQQDIVEELIKSSYEILPGLKEELVLRYSPFEKRPLEEVIDQGNIHGWLQNQINIIENKLAYTITTIMKENKDSLACIESIFFNKGKDISTSINLESPGDAYKLMNDSLLDGMPCDHVNQIIDQDENQIIWKRNQCVHQNFWEIVGGNIELYYELRKSFIKGLLYNSTLTFETLEDNQYRIRRS